MRIVNDCRDRALILLQIACECPEFDEQATYLAHEWLGIAELRISAGLVKPAEKTVRAD